VHYEVHLLTKGADSLVQAKVIRQGEGVVLKGKDSNLDTVSASIKTYIEARNNMNIIKQSEKS